MTSKVYKIPLQTWVWAPIKQRYLTCIVAVHNLKTKMSCSTEGRLWTANPGGFWTSLWYLRFAFSCHAFISLKTLMWLYFGKSPESFQLSDTLYSTQRNCWRNRIHSCWLIWSYFLFLSLDRCRSILYVIKNFFLISVFIILAYFFNVFSRIYFLLYMLFNHFCPNNLNLYFLLIHFARGWSGN